MKKVIFVCTGGTCRSPMAEHIFKHKLKQRGISGKQVTVSSAGILAQLGLPISLKTVEVLKEMGISASAKQKSRQLNKKMVNKNTLIITMTDGHKEWLKNLDNVKSLSQYEKDFEINDPFAKPIESYREVAKQLNYILDLVMNEIIK